jgi:ketosteroid isomerase-like protein
MMKRLVVCAALAAAACTGGARPGEEFTTKDASNIRQRSDTFVKAFNAKDVSQILDMYAENSVFMPPNQPVIRGKDALRMFYDDLINKQGGTNLKLDAADVAGHGPLAYQSGTYELDYKPAAGNAAHDRGKYLFILRNMTGTWRYEYTMWNSDLPPRAQGD